MAEIFKTKEAELAFKDVVQKQKLTSHTHKSVDEIISDLNIGPLERIFLWLAKTDYYALALTTFHSRLTLGGLGLMVIFTSLMAFSSAVYGLHSMLIAPDIGLHWPVVIGLALIYAFGILVIDREIVGAVNVNWQSIFIRLIFAVFIATVVSYPVKMVFFNGRIVAEVKQMVDERNTVKIQEIKTLKNTGEHERLEQRKIISSHLEQVAKVIDDTNATKAKELANWDSNLTHENKDKGGIGKYFRGKTAEKAAVENKYALQLEPLYATQKELERQLVKLNIPGTLPDNVQADIKKRQDAIDLEKKNSYDFLSKFQALNKIGEEAGLNFQIMSWFLMAFFMMLEMVPLGLKLALGKTEYHYYMDARANLTNQKIISLSNGFIELIQKDPNVIFDLPPEISQVLAGQIEDEALETVMPDSSQAKEVLNPNRSELSEQDVTPDIDPPTTDEPMSGDRRV